MNNTKYTKHLISSFTLASLLLFSSCGWPTANESGAKTITAVDGCIKDATVTDSLGQVAKYLGKEGQYKFASNPTYPITLSGGTLTTGEELDIQMSVNDGKSLVISPITSFINNDSTLMSKLTNAGFTGINTMEGFGVDYIATNKKDLAIK